MKQVKNTNLNQGFIVGVAKLGYHGSSIFLMGRDS